MVFSIILVVRIAEDFFSEYIFMLLGFKCLVQKWNVKHDFDFMIFIKSLKHWTLT